MITSPIGKTDWIKVAHKLKSKSSILDHAKTALPLKFPCFSDLTSQTVPQHEQSTSDRSSGGNSSRCTCGAKQRSATGREGPDRDVSTWGELIQTAGGGNKPTYGSLLQEK